MQCIQYGSGCRGVVLESIYRTIDEGVKSTLPEAAVFVRPPSGGGGAITPNPSSIRRRYSVFSRSNSGKNEVIGGRRSRYTHTHYIIMSCKYCLNMKRLFGTVS